VLVLATNTRSYIQFIAYCQNVSVWVSCPVSVLHNSKQFDTLTHVELIFLLCHCFLFRFMWNTNDDDNYNYFSHVSLINVEFVFIFVAELMILGFISLLLTFGQSYMVKICIPANATDQMLPCPYRATRDAKNDEEEHHRKLLYYERRYLSEDGSPYNCKEVTMLPYFVFL